MKNLFTSESVTCGHPDKVADQISDAILDLCLIKDKNAHVACETMVTCDRVILCGEIGGDLFLEKDEIENTVRETIKNIGYIYDGVGFKYDTFEIENNIHEQSAEINAGVIESEDKEQGAGDQGLMFGYATNETGTDSYMPFPIYLARELSNRLTYMRENNILPYLMPDGKTQVTYDYDKNKIDTIVLSTMHKADISLDELRKDMTEKVILPIVKDIDGINIHINPCGSFIIGGPCGDTGLTGRKIIVDTYGGMARHGGGAFSGKDPSKVDRSAADMMRYVAKNIVAAGLCDKCEVQVAYAIGEAKPVGVYVNTFGTSKGSIKDERIVQIINDTFNLTPKGIITDLNLLRPIYLQTAKYGHFGAFPYTWEKTDKVQKIK